LTSYIKTDIRTKQADQRRLFFLGSSLNDFEDLPKDIKEDFLTGLTVARIGGTPPNMKPWKGLGSGVYELLEDHRGDTYRAVYTVRFAEAMYVLHIFKKKSKSGIKTPLPDIRKVDSRIKEAESHYEENFKGKGKR
jgi:phage-related protein